MRKLSWARVPYCAALLIGILVACGSDDAATDPVFPAPPGANDAAGGGDGTGGNPGSSDATVPDCADPKNAPPITSFPTCCPEGKAHCVPSSIMGAAASRFTTCAASEASAGSCVPDTRLKGGKLPSCTSLNNQPGACQSLCVPEVANYKDLLPQSTCSADERCAPCISPIDNKSTGACDDNVSPLALFACNDGGTFDGSAPDGSTGECPHVGPPVVDPNTFASCHPSNGAHCVPSTSVPPDQAALLATCKTSTGVGGRCVPDTVIKTGGRFILPTCNSIGGGEGRCVHVAIPQVAAQGNKIPQSTCPANEKCTPCFDPVSGAPTGICKLGCDPGPTAGRPVYKFPACCQNLGGGRCVPASFVPPESSESIRQDTCAAGNSCIPSEFLNPAYVPPPCTAPSVAYILSGGSYTGVCLSNCLQFDALQSLIIARGNCSAVQKCVPCKDPQGAPTGAPGCPP